MMSFLDGETGEVRSIRTNAGKRRALAERFVSVRRMTLELTEPLTAEDMAVQASEDASPVKWRLGHTTWFFERFVLAAHMAGYRASDESFSRCFGGGREGQGPGRGWPGRGTLSRPSTESVLSYRGRVDDAVLTLLGGDAAPEALRLIEVGVNHEEQHQELMLTDILALFAANRLRPAYSMSAPRPGADIAGTPSWIDYPGGVYAVGNHSETFAWDNEKPRHRILVHPFRLATALVTNGDWLDFIADGGYRASSLWLADGWAWASRRNRRAPLYWEKRDGEWRVMTLTGLRPVDLAAPVAHISYYEADAFAAWVGKRLPTEFEWEVAASGQSGLGVTPRQMFGEVWQWTRSAYQAYPGYRRPEGPLGEYNSRFMSGRLTLRGSSCATPPGHSRPTYRNFLYPGQSWQFSGMRLASDGS